MNSVLASLLERSGGVISRRAYPQLGTAIDWHVRRGDLVRVLPGVYCLSHTDGWRARVDAATVWNKSAIITGEAAAALTFWPDRSPNTVLLAGVQSKSTWPGFTMSSRVVPPTLTIRLGRRRISTADLTAIDLVPEFGADVIDDALRSRMATLGGMRRALALTPDRTANPRRTAVLLDSTGEPWSAGERLAHRHLRAAGIHRWRANVPIVCGGRTYYQDIAMDDCPVVIEVDGKVHMRPDVFESDRRRGNDLLLAGKHVLHFTYAMLRDEADWFVACTRSAIEMCGARR